MSLDPRKNPIFQDKRGRGISVIAGVLLVLGLGGLVLVNQISLWDEMLNRVATFSVVGQVDTGEQSVRIRRATDLVWMNTQTSQTDLGRGDRIFTDENNSAKIRVQNKLSIEMAANTLVVIESADPTSPPSNTPTSALPFLSVRQGAIRVQLEAGASPTPVRIRIAEKVYEITGKAFEVKANEVQGSSLEVSVPPEVTNLSSESSEPILVSEVKLTGATEELVPLESPPPSPPSAVNFALVRKPASIAEQTLEAEEIIAQEVTNSTRAEMPEPILNRPSSLSQKGYGYFAGGVGYCKQSVLGTTPDYSAEVNPLATGVFAKGVYYPFENFGFESQYQFRNFKFQGQGASTRKIEIMPTFSDRALSSFPLFYTLGVGIQNLSNSEILALSQTDYLRGSVDYWSIAPQIRLTAELDSKTNVFVGGAWMKSFGYQGGARTGATQFTQPLSYSVHLGVMGSWFRPWGIHVQGEYVKDGYRYQSSGETVEADSTRTDFQFGILYEF